MSDGSSSQSARFCPQCGAALRADAQFCTACGTPVAADPAASKRPAAAASRQRGRPWLAIGAVVLLLAAAAGALVWFNNSQQPAASPAVMIPTVPVASQNIPYPDVARVSVEQAHISAMSGEAVLVDVRDLPFYQMGHARGAISLPLNELPARFSELPKDKAVLFYCT